MMLQPSLLEFMFTLLLLPLFNTVKQWRSCSVWMTETIIKTNEKKLYTGTLSTTAAIKTVAKHIHVFPSIQHFEVFVCLKSSNRDNWNDKSLNRWWSPLTNHRLHVDLHTQSKAPGSVNYISSQWNQCPAASAGSILHGRKVNKPVSLSLCELLMGNTTCLRCISKTPCIFSRTLLCSISNNGKGRLKAPNVPYLLPRLLFK